MRGAKCTPPHYAQLDTASAREFLDGKALGPPVLVGLLVSHDRTRAAAHLWQMPRSSADMSIQTSSAGPGEAGRTPHCATVPQQGTS